MFDKTRSYTEIRNPHKIETPRLSGALQAIGKNLIMLLSSDLQASVSEVKRQKPT